jgi:hypothetical protein
MLRQIAQIVPRIGLASDGQLCLHPLRLGKEKLKVTSPMGLVYVLLAVVGRGRSIWNMEVQQLCLSDEGYSHPFPFSAVYLDKQALAFPRGISSEVEPLHGSEIPENQGSGPRF